MTENQARPKLSVVIPTYNRADLLGKTLQLLARQGTPATDFEVIVSDDGSSDSTRAVAESFSDQLRMKYHFQEDRGSRAAATRNAGARLAEAPILAFLDTGAMVGPDYVDLHVAAHSGTRTHSFVAGYAHAYNPDAMMPGLNEALDRMPPEKVFEQFREDPGFIDVRHGTLAKLDFDLGRSLLPWMLCWGMNCSISQAAFWKIGGWDENFEGWGVEDMEFAYRVHINGVPIQFSRDAWVIHAPHERDRKTEVEQLMVNIQRFATRHPVPVVEIGWGVITKYYYPFSWEDEYRHLLAWGEKCRDLDVGGEIAEVVPRIPEGATIAVIGVGGRTPESLPPSIVMDFDRELLDRATAAGRHVGHQSIGIRTPLADKSVDDVILTTRLAGPRERWDDEILAEAHRIGRRVHTTGNS